ncbi:uncharacterized protein LOC110464377 [Mizuhopecten yessoensis]|uniref:Prolyl 4-hydroxylase subunit alpha-2 n=1 Tax=Mizuhopecten yessoensis TaxID=6573 RepID=A0A210PU50_MIZYE|nr:uncharacterized protein LOC110464377 [Mizuhopecten yessoensis]OWF40008.1 Prolyl 4-hydroxylase subunit alpha-2 [Mizuhopecten yessoensis]
MGQKTKKRGVSSGVRGVPKGSGHTPEKEKTVNVLPSTRFLLGIIVCLGLAILFALLYPQISGPASDRVARLEPEQLETDSDSWTVQDTAHLKNDDTDDVPVLKQNDPMIDEDIEPINNAKQTVPLTRKDDGKIHFTQETKQSNEEKQHHPSKDNGSSTQSTSKTKIKSSPGKNKKKSKSLKKEASSKSASRTKTDASSPTSTPSDEEELPKEVRDFKPTFQKTMKPKKIFADGRRLPPIELLPQKPNNSSVKVFLYDEFLSEAECDGLMKVHDSHVTQANKHDPFVCFDSISTLRQHLKANKVKVKVTPQDFMPGTLCVNATFSTQLKSWLHSNWSYSTAFYPGESRFSKVFEYRVKEATGLLPENGGKFQLTSYPLGIGYKTHTDCIENSNDQRDRMATILVYLQDVEDGGETMFPELGIWVKPRKGRALVWNNMNEDGKCEPLSIHKAAKVDQGHKYILQRWYYYKSFYSLGKRPPEPEIPHRAEFQGRVSCDEYQHGSCRWYDEWNYDHLVDYLNRKATLI